MPPFEDAVVVLTGADGGIGSLLLEEVLQRGARLVHACGLRRDVVDGHAGRNHGRVQAHILDVTDQAGVAAFAAGCPGTSMLINCAGVELKKRVTDPQAPRAALLEMAVNYQGTANLCHAFVPILANAASAQIVNVLSIASLAVIVPLGAYGSAKTAAHVLTLCLREETRGSGIRVHGVYPGWVDTVMAAGVDGPKADPRQLVQTICDELSRGTESIFPDAMSQALVTAHPQLLAPPIFLGMHA